MARQSRSRPAARPAARPAPTQTRSASSVAAPSAPSFGQKPGVNPASSAPHPPPGATSTQSSGQPGMMAQMAATAGSVAVGSTIGHGLSSMLFGGSSSAPAEQQQQQQTSAPPQQSTMSCDAQALDFSKCLDKADLNSCSYYLDQLKACQAAAAPY